MESSMQLEGASAILFWVILYSFAILRLARIGTWELSPLRLRAFGLIAMVIIPVTAISGIAAEGFTGLIGNFFSSQLLLGFVLLTWVPVRRASWPGSI
jgi:hypothetical protein